MENNAIKQVDKAKDLGLITEHCISHNYKKRKKYIQATPTHSKNYISFPITA